MCWLSSLKKTARSRLSSRLIPLANMFRNGSDEEQLFKHEEELTMTRILRMSGVIVALVTLSVTSLALPDSKEDDRNKIRAATKQTLAALYKKQPEAQGAIARAAGYAVFTNKSLKIFVT